MSAVSVLAAHFPERFGILGDDASASSHREADEERNMVTAREMVEIFQCQGCSNGMSTRCGSFKLQEIASAKSLDDGAELIGGFRCRNHIAGTNIGGFVNVGLPIPFARVQYRTSQEEVRTNIRMHLYPVDYGTYWDGFNVPVWALELKGYLFVRTYCPRTDQSYVDVIKGGSIAMIRERFSSVIDIGPITDRIKL